MVVPERDRRRSPSAHEVQTCTIEGLSWGEVDFPADLIRAERLAEAWEKRV